MLPPVISAKGFTEFTSITNKRQQVEQRKQEQNQIDQRPRHAACANGGILRRNRHHRFSLSSAYKYGIMIAAIVISMIVAEAAPIPIWFRVKV